MSLDRWLQIQTATLAVLGALFLGLGQNHTVLPIALAAAAIVSILQIPIISGLRMNRILANVIALGAVLWSLRDFFNTESDRQLIAIADMLVYLQIVLLFQGKTQRIYWQLLVLSLLQVVVAAALNLGPQFGLLLAIYITIAISALVMLCLQREFLPPDAPVESPVVGGGADSHAGLRLLMAPSMVVGQHRVAARALRGWPQMVLRQVGLITGATMIFATIFFYATPRTGEGAWLGPRVSGQKETGFDSVVTLEEEGTIEESNQLIMRVVLSRLSDERPYTLLEDPYFHGMVLTNYSSDGGGSRWSAQSSRIVSSLGVPSLHVNQPRASTMLVRQDYSLESAPTGVVFAIFPVHHLPETSELKLIRSANRLIRDSSSDSTPHREYRYSLATMALRDGRQLKCQPHLNALRLAKDTHSLVQEKLDLCEYDAERFDELKQFTDELLAAKGLSNATSLERIKALESHFHEPEAYHYSLAMTFTRDKKLDPIVDFVLNHRTGHCEYFASALAMMLRTQGIPSRMVVGFKGGEFNFLGHYYQVRAKHAHAWVEAYLPPEEVPDEEVAGTPGPAGAWYRLDPTPAMWGRDIENARDSLSDRIGDAFDYVDLLWRDYVLGLNSSRQQDSIYDPLTERASSTLPGWDEATRFSSTMRGLMKKLGVSNQPNPDDGRQWFDWRMGLAAVCSMFAFIGISQLSMLVMRRYSVGTQKHAGRSSSAQVPAFYRRLEAVLATLKLHRLPAQTPREFARSAEAKLAPLVTGVDVASLPPEVVQLYYRVRFGGFELTPEEAAVVDQAITKLQAAAKNPAVKSALAADAAAVSRTGMAVKNGEKPVKSP